MSDISLLGHIPLTASSQSSVPACKAVSECLHAVCEIMPSCISLANNIKIMWLGTAICFSVNQNNISP